MKPPVIYRLQMLVIVAPQGVAAVVFDKPVNTEPRERTVTFGPKHSSAETRVIKEYRTHEVSYRYRFLPAGETKETTGEGRLFETSPLYDDEGEIIQGTASHDIWIEAGEIKLRWSRFNNEGGWLYYQPEEIIVSFDNPRRFADHVGEGSDGQPRVTPGDRRLDLSRFRSLSRSLQVGAAEQ